MNSVATIDEVLDFWFADAQRARWYNSTPEFDAQIRQRFEATWCAARDGLLADWERSPRGALALVVVLDQFPLNMYRGQALSWSTEAAARGVAARALAVGHDRELDVEQRAVLFLPFMHSEQLDDQQRSVDLYTAAGLEDGARWARHHCEIIRRFGRFPHRNAALGRPSTAEERAWLASDEGFGG